MCEYCKRKGFNALNNTVDYSGLEIAISNSGLEIAISNSGSLRVRNYNFKDIFETQDVVNINYCPMCRKKVR